VADPGFEKGFIRGSGKQQSPLRFMGKALIGSLEKEVLLKLVICKLY